MTLLLKTLRFPLLPCFFHSWLSNKSNLIDTYSCVFTCYLLKTLYSVPSAVWAHSACSVNIS